MKTKAFKKKLDLNKNTVANLNLNQMNALRGGTARTATDVTCGETCEGCDYENSDPCWSDVLC
jgi:natural product precursor